MGLLQAGGPRTAWCRSPCPPLEREEIHVWRIALDEPPIAADALEPTLSADEQERAARYRFERDRRRFIAARGCLRHLLGGYLGVAPPSLEFVYSPGGKPSLPAETNADDLRFNLSHSGELALVAVTRGREVGIDVEDTTKEVAHLDLATRFFSADEAAVLRSLPEPERPPGFFRCWTRKEAYVKARGDGLSLGLDTFAVTLRSEDTPALVRCDSARDAVKRWALFHLEPGPGYVGALAVEGRVLELRLLEME